MKICLINALFPPHAYGGAESYVKRVANALDTRGHNVSILTTKPNDQGDDPEHTTLNGIDVWQMESANFSHRSNGTGSNLISKAVWHQINVLNPVATQKVGHLLDELQPDVVHTNNLMGLTTLVGRSIGKRDIRHIHTLHDYSLICPKGTLLREWTAPDDELVPCENPPTPCRLYKRQHRLALGQPDVVLSPSNHVIDVHRQHELFESSQTYRLQLGVESINENCNSVEDHSVLYVGKHTEAKGIRVVLNAAEILSDVTFHFCGSGSDDNITEARANDNENIIYHGYVSEKELLRLRRESSVAVVPSLWMENSPFVIYEHFATGLPVVASDIGGIPELVKDGKTGALFQPGDTQALAKSVRELLENDDRRDAASKRAIEWARNHTLEAHINELLSIYQVDQ
jgi:glycosyltransferase involved in cell wall biosynthesis